MDTACEGSKRLEVRARKKFRAHKNREPIVQATVNLKAGTRLAGRFALSLLHPECTANTVSDLQGWGFPKG